MRDALAKRDLDLASARIWAIHVRQHPATSWLGRLLGRGANPVDPDLERDDFVVLLPGTLAVVSHGPKRGTIVLAARLVVLSIETPYPDAHAGFTLSGFHGEPGRPGTYFVGLGRGDEAEACYAAVREALAG